MKNKYLINKCDMYFYKSFFVTQRESPKTKRIFYMPTQLNNLQKFIYTNKFTHTHTHNNCVKIKRTRKH